ncbi:hypothetical protein cym2001_11080 [Pseudomonas sp. CYM-20-01]|nr:hypothetical protein cym2001_11080 [Pseudomonas sp. CYM-20-01]
MLVQDQNAIAKRAVERNVSTGDLIAIEIEVWEVDCVTDGTLHLPRLEHLVQYESVIPDLTQRVYFVSLALVNESNPRRPVQSRLCFDTKHAQIRMQDHEIDLT